MPSHIFTRVGYWKESIVSNAESARIAKLDGEQHDQAHGMDYLVYAHLQLAQDKKAKAVADELATIEFKLDRFVGPYAVAASHGALRGGAQRLEGGGRAPGAADEVSLC